MPDVDTTPVELLFPRHGDHAAVALAEFIASPTTRLRLAIYSLNHPRIVAAIGRQWAHKVPTQLITDRVQAAGHQELPVLRQFLDAGLPVRANHHTGLMHLKLAIRGEPPDGLALGSFNWTNAAEATNDEVLAIITDSTLAANAADVFDRMWDDHDRFTDWRPPTSEELRAMFLERPELLQMPEF
jgi:phosphatidylserine/phosphatidylglycerophosphate/cardiolipin synthase-like enzyme